jgi:hypothetical protein
VSSIQYTQSAPPATTAVKRPGVLTAATIATLLSGVSLLIGAISVFVGGKQAMLPLAEEYFNKELGSLGAGQVISDRVMTEVYDTLSMRAGIGVFIAVLLLLAALASRNASPGGRAFLTVAILLVGPFEIMVARDFAPTLLKATGGFAVFVSFVAFVLVWLPPSGRFALDRAWGRRK